jgi:spoIIIJ-associated protein
MNSMDREFEGKDLEEALASAAADLGIAEPDLDYEILEQGRRGLFGIGAKSVRIRVMPPVEPAGEPREPRPAAPRPARSGRTRSSRQSRSRSKQKQKPKQQQKKATSTPPEPIPEAVIDDIRTTVQRMVELMGLQLEIQAGQVDSGVTVELGGPDRKLLTQKDGELIGALQFLLNRMARRAWPGSGRIHLASNGDRRKRDEELVELTREVIQQVTSTGKTQRLHPMNAYDRRLVHIAVREHPELGSRSEGNGHLKRVRIFKSKK